MKTSVWLPPVLVAAGVAAIGWMVRYILTSITGQIDDLETTFTKVSGELAQQHAVLMEKHVNLDRRVVRLEAWKDLLHIRDEETGKQP